MLVDMMVDYLSERAENSSEEIREDYNRWMTDEVFGMPPAFTLSRAGHRQVWPVIMSVVDEAARSVWGRAEGTMAISRVDEGDDVPEGWDNETLLREMMAAGSA